MLRTDKPIYKAILILNLFLIATCLILCFTNLDYSNTFILLSRLSNVLGLIFAAFYIVYGYRKNAAGYFKVFGLACVATKVFALISALKNSKNIFSIVICVIIASIFLVLTLSSNLGKSKSLVLCGIAVLLSLVGIIYTIPTNVFAKTAVVNLVSFELNCLYGILTYAKYLDKAERGTK